MVRLLCLFLGHACANTVLQSTGLRFGSGAQDSVDTTYDNALHQPFLASRASARRTEMSPFALAHWSRFDILIKWAYSGYMMREHRLFETSADRVRANNLAQEVYIEHERALNGLWDTRTTTQKTWAASTSFCDR